MSEEMYFQDYARDLPYSTDEIKSERADLIERAKSEIVQISPFLHEVCSEIEAKKPDYVLFLDKGARILAAPVRLFLSENIEGSLPKIGRYNDEDLKQAYISGKTPISEASHKHPIWQELQGKKIFFIDETFASGKSVIALEQAANANNVDFEYFALSRAKDPIDLSNMAGFEVDKYYSIDQSVHLDNLARVLNDPRIHINQYVVSDLFTSPAAKLIVVDDIDRKKRVTTTQSRYKLTDASYYDYSKEPEDWLAALDSRRITSAPDGMSWKQYDDFIRTTNTKTVRTLTHLIYESLQKEKYKTFLDLTPEEFDQDEEKGWRKLEKAGKALEAAKVVELYLHTHHDKLTNGDTDTMELEKFMHFHVGQLLALQGEKYYQQAVGQFEQSYLVDAEGWNYYVRGSVAFLQKDIPALKTCINGMEALEKKLVIGIKNLDILYRFASALDNSQTYKQAYENEPDK